MARKMVCEWGMSDRMGPLTFGKSEEHIFLGREVARAKDYSEETAILIDSEIKRIVMECATRAKQMLETNLEKLHALARALLERESLDGEEIARILACRRSRRPQPRLTGRAQGRSRACAAIPRSRRPDTAPRHGSLRRSRDEFRSADAAAMDRDSP